MKQLRYDYLDYLEAGKTFPAGWAPVEFDVRTREWVIARRWFVPFAIVWHCWSMASRQFLQQLPKGRHA